MSGFAVTHPVHVVAIPPRQQSSETPALSVPAAVVRVIAGGGLARQESWDEARMRD